MSIRDKIESSFLIATTMNSSQRSLRQRLLLIARGPRMLAVTLVIVLAVMIVAAACAFGGAGQPAPPPPPAQTEDEPAAAPLQLGFDPAWYQQEVFAYGGERFYIEDGVLYWDGYHFFYPISAELPKGEYYEHIEVAENAVHVDIAETTGNIIYIDGQQRLFGWGPNNNGLLLSEPSREQRVDENLSMVEQPQLLMEEVAYASLGGGHILALKSDGSLWAWGLNANGELGDGSQGHERPYGTSYDIAPYSAEPLHILDNVAYCLAFGYSSAALQADGTLWTWGDNSFGQIGNGERGYGMPTISDNIVPSPYQALTDVVWIWPEQYHEIDNLYARRQDGSTWAWGEDYGSTPALLPQQEQTPPPQPQYQLSAAQQAALDAVREEFNEVNATAWLESMLPYFSISDDAYQLHLQWPQEHRRIDWVVATVSWQGLDYFFYLLPDGGLRHMGESWDVLDRFAIEAPEKYSYIEHGDHGGSDDINSFPRQINAVWNGPEPQSGDFRQGMPDPVSGQRAIITEEEYWLDTRVGGMYGQDKSATLLDITAERRGLTLTYISAEGDALFVGGGGIPNMELSPGAAEGQWQLYIPEARLAEGYTLSENEGHAVNVSVRSSIGERGVMISFELDAAEEFWLYRYDYALPERAETDRIYGYVQFKKGSSV